MPKYDVWYQKPRREVNDPYAVCFDATAVHLGRLVASHVKLLEAIEKPNLEAVYRYMQGEVWSPNGEARGLIETSGLAHTSMSVGDVIYEHDRDLWFVVDVFGFTELDSFCRLDDWFEWESLYRPIANPGGSAGDRAWETFGDEWRKVLEVHQQDPGKVWTFLDVGAEPEDYEAGTVYDVCSGLHWVNRIYYYLTEVSLPPGIIVEVGD